MVSFTTHHHSVQRWLAKPLILLACLAVAAVLIPLAPGMPTAGLDTSWNYAMNEAVARHIPLGRSLSSTFGPYTGLYTAMYHPATDRLMLLAGASLATFFIAAIVWAARTASVVAVAAFAYAVLLQFFIKDALLVPTVIDSAVTF